MRKFIFLCVVLLLNTIVSAHVRVIDVNFNLDPEKKIKSYRNVMLEAAYAEKEDQFDEIFSDIMHTAGDITVNQPLTAQMTIVDGSRYVEIKEIKLKYDNANGEPETMTVKQLRPSMCVFVRTADLESIEITIEGDKYPFYFSCVNKRPEPEEVQI